MGVRPRAQLAAVVSAVQRWAGHSYGPAANAAPDHPLGMAPSWQLIALIEWPMVSKGVFRPTNGQARVFISRNIFGRSGYR